MSLKRYTFESLSEGSLLPCCGKEASASVVAENEADARHKLMVERWGEPYGIYAGRKYEAKGFALFSVVPLG